MKNKAAQALGSIKSPKKAKSSRENGMRKYILTEDMIQILKEANEKLEALAAKGREEWTRTWGK